MIQLKNFEENFKLHFWTVLEPPQWQTELTKEELVQQLATISKSADHLNGLLRESEATNAILMEQIKVSRHMLSKFLSVSMMQAHFTFSKSFRSCHVNLPSFLLLSITSFCPSIHMDILTFCFLRVSASSYRVSLTTSTLDTSGNIGLANLGYVIKSRHIEWVRSAKSMGRGCQEVKNWKLDFKMELPLARFFSSWNLLYSKEDIILCLCSFHVQD